MTLAVHGGQALVSAELARPWPQLSTAAMERAVGLLKAGDLSDYDYGDTLAELERTVSHYQDGQYALATSSGTDALFSAYLGVGVEPGDEVIVPSYSFHATVAPLFALSAIPVLCDVDPLTGCADIADVEQRITDRTRAIAVTHMWGHPVDMDPLLGVANRHDIRVVEDGSHAHGATYRNQLVGTFGDAAAFSFGARKMVSGGMGGAMVTRDPTVHREPLRVGHTHERAARSWPEDEVAVGLGGNHRISLVAAAIVIEQYRDLDARIETKRAVLEGLSVRLQDVQGLHPQYTANHVTRGGWYGYKARYVAADLDSLDLDTFIDAAQAEGVPVSRPSNQPLHWRPVFRSNRLDPPYYCPGRERPLYTPGQFPGAERYYHESLSFPAPYLHEPCDDLLDQWVAALNKVVNARDQLLR